MVCDDTVLASNKIKNEQQGGRRMAKNNERLTHFIVNMTYSRNQSNSHAVYASHYENTNF